MWSCNIFDTLSGQLAQPIDIPNISWSLTVGDCSLATTRDKGVGEDEGSGLTVPWDALGDIDSAARHSALAPMRRGIVLMWDGVPVVAGAIGARSDSWYDTSFTLLGPMGLMEGRYAVVEGQFGRGPNSTTPSFHRWGGQSFRSIVAQLVNVALTKPGGMLPIDYRHYMGERGAHERTYWGYNVSNASISSLIENITNVEGGPDVQFRPYLSDESHLRWRLIAGSDGDPTIADDLSDTPCLTCFPGGGTAQDITVAQLSPVMRVYGTGAGQDTETLCAAAEDMTLCTRSDPWPLVETTTSNGDWETADLVRGHAKALLDASKEPLIQIKCTVSARDAHNPVKPGVLWPGQRVDLEVREFPTLPDGVYHLRLMEMSGDLGDRIDLTFDQCVEPWESMEGVSQL